MKTELFHHEAIFFALFDSLLCAQQCRSHLHACMQLSTYIKGECDPIPECVSTQAEGSTLMRVHYDLESFFSPIDLLIPTSNFAEGVNLQARSSPAQHALHPVAAQIQPKLILLKPAIKSGRIKATD